MADASDRIDAEGPPGGPETGSLSLSLSVDKPQEPAREVVRARVLACYQEHGGELGRFVLGVVRDPDLAGDVMQATLSKALEQGHAAGAETLKGWLFRVAFHEALAIRRRARVGDVALRRWAERGGALASPGGAPDDRLIQSETVQAVRRALSRLPDDQRRVVLARIDEEKTFAQIARDAGLPLGTVLTRMRLALEKLRRVLEIENR